MTGAQGRPVANAVVYLEDAPVEPGRGDKASIDQKNMLFLPYVTAIAAGGTVHFNNSDPFPHNVYSASDDKFNMGMISSHAARTRTFKKPGAFRLLCNLHPNMLAYVVVAPSSYFAVTNGQGKFTIKDVPEGSYKLGAWAAGLVADPTSVTVSGGDASTTITLHK